MAVLRLGLIGAGGMGRSLAQAAKAREDACIVAVADPLPEAAAKAVAELGGEAVESYQALLARDDVDAVLVATPNHTHCEITLAAVAAGKHVFCEKPMALTVADCDRMIAAAERAGVKLMVGQVLRLIPAFAKTLALARSGELGRPLAVAIERSSMWRFTGWRAQRSLTGGVLYEINAHEMDFMRALLGEPKRVFALIPECGVIPDSDTPGVNYVSVEFQSGAVGMLNSNVLLPQGRYEIAVTCSEGSIRCAWRGIEYQRRDGEMQTVPEEELKAMTPGVAWEIGSFVEWVLHGTPPVVTAYDGRGAVELAQAANLSAATGQPVTLPLG